MNTYIKTLWISATITGIGLAKSTIYPINKVYENLKHMITSIYFYHLISEQ